MRLTAITAIALTSLHILFTGGCSKPTASTQSDATVSLSVDMPRDQTLQFLKQSATTLKLSASTSATSDTVSAGPSKGVVSGPDTGPVTVVFTGDSSAVAKWSKMFMDKLPAKKL